MIIQGSWIKLDWINSEEAGELLFEIHVPPNPSFPAYYQGATSKNVFRLNHSFGTPYQWYGLRLRED